MVKRQRPGVAAFPWVPLYHGMQRVNRAAKQYAARRRDPTRRYTRRIPRPIMSTVATPRSVRPTRVRTVSAVRKSTWRTRWLYGSF